MAAGAKVLAGWFRANAFWDTKISGMSFRPASERDDYNQTLAPTINYSKPSESTDQALIMPTRNQLYELSTLSIVVLTADMICV